MSAPSQISENILRIANQYSTYSGLIIAILGAIGNGINITVFRCFRLFRKNRCALYLIIESTLGFIYNIYAIIIACFLLIYQSDLLDRSLLWCRCRITIVGLISLGTYAIICWEATDQFFSTNYRFYVKNIFTMKSARWIAAITVGLCTIHAGLTSLFYTIRSSSGCSISTTIGYNYSLYFFYPILVGLLPIILSSSFSLLAFRNVRLIIRRQIPIQRRRFDRQITAMILIRVAGSTIFSLPFIIHQITLAMNPLTTSNPESYAIGQLIRRITISIVAFVFSANFYIFIFSSPRYRRQVKYVLFKKLWQNLRQFLRSKNNRIVPSIRACGTATSIFEAQNASL